LIKNVKVLIHCNKGISRAPTLGIAYLMKKFNWKFEEIFEYIKKIYPKADPNYGFIIQLMDF